MLVGINAADRYPFDGAGTAFERHVALTDIDLNLLNRADSRPDRERRSRHQRSMIEQGVGRVGVRSSRSTMPWRYMQLRNAVTCRG